MPFSAARLRDNAWGRSRDSDREYVSSYAGESDETRADRIKPRSSFHLDKAAGGAHYGQKEGPEGRKGVWAEGDYTQFDLCSGERWPFEDQQFDLGLCSHTLEDLREPVGVVRELARVCKKVLIISPSRLLEQTRGIEHPKYCGFYHHLWMLTSHDSAILFRRKSQILNLKGTHLVCPLKKTLSRERGSFFWYGSSPEAREVACWNEQEDYDDYAGFIAPYRHDSSIFVRERWHRNIRYIVWRLRQIVFGRL
jgi:hypothetical protein